MPKSTSTYSDAALIDAYQQNPALRASTLFDEQPWSTNVSYWRIRNDTNRLIKAGKIAKPTGPRPYKPKESVNAALQAEKDKPKAKRLSWTSEEESMIVLWLLERPKESSRGLSLDEIRDLQQLLLGRTIGALQRKMTDLRNLLKEDKDSTLPAADADGDAAMGAVNDAPIHDSADMDAAQALFDLSQQAVVFPPVLSEEEAAHILMALHEADSMLPYKNASKEASETSEHDSDGMEF